MQTESSPASAQLFSSLGEQLRAQRLARHMSIDDVATQLRLPAAIIETMERNDVAQLGAVVFARGRFGSYARLVGVPASAVEAQFAHAVVAPPMLVSSTHGSRVEYAVKRFARQSMYIVLTATIVLPVIWLATHNELPQSTASLTALDNAPVAANSTAKPVRTDSKAARIAHNEQEQPLAASIAPFGNYDWANASSAGGNTAAPAAHAVDPMQLAQPAANGNTMQMRFSGDSWVDIVGIDGRAIEHGIVAAGSVRNYQTAAIARVTIGNANSVLVMRNDEPLDLKAFQKANVTRFTLSSDGNLAPLRD